MQGDNAEHYKRVSSCYDSMYSDNLAAKVSIINRQLQFTSGDTVLDIGGGTAGMSQRLWKTHNLKAPVLCVDPSDAMLQIARGKLGVETIKATAEEFFVNYSDRKVFSKILMISCYHHFKDPGLVFEGVARLLSDDGVCLVTHAEYEPLLFSRLGKLLDIDYSQIAKHAEANGLKAQITSDSEVREVTKESCFSFLRNRMFSILNEFTDSEIEEGIKELDQRYDGDTVQAAYEFTIATITK